MKSGTHRFLRILPKASGVTLLALLLSMFLTSPFTATLSGMFSTPERGDFRMTDLYAQVADGRPVRMFDDRIVLVDIGLATREQIAEGLQILSLCEPEAIGLDVNFAHPGDCDTLLTDAIAANPGIVLPLALKQTDDNKFLISEKPFFYDSLQGPAYGAINFPAEREGASIREFATGFDMAQGQAGIPSFVAAIAAHADPDATEILHKRGNRHETIDYASREFKVIPIEDLTDRAEEITDRCVIMGAMNEAGDMHPTPINSYVSGMQIHAYALSTILDHRYLSYMPRWIDYITAIMLCLVMVTYALYSTAKTRGLTLRFMQVMLLFLMVWTGYSLYVDRALVCDFSYTLIMLTFGLFALDVWNGAEGVGENGIKYYKKIKRKICEARY